MISLNFSIQIFAKHYQTKNTLILLYTMYILRTMPRWITIMMEKSHGATSMEIYYTELCDEI